MIPAEPNYTYLELNTFDGKVTLNHKHPVIGWVEASHGGFSQLAMLPVMMVQRAEKDWGVQYPNGNIVGDDGQWYRDANEFLTTAQDFEDWPKPEKVKEPA
jgi:hypothetical protein